MILGTTLPTKNLSRVRGPDVAVFKVRSLHGIYPNRDLLQNVFVFSETCVFSFHVPGCSVLGGWTGRKGRGEGGSVFRVPVFLALILHAPAEVHCRMFLRHGLYIGFS